ncbi:MAG: acyl-CoA dehydrogenase [Actinomycetia bacterium]|nr:acyl-CoA dehydrogenase [Actinomycetes bacterium]MCP4222844.1 acyl-CoA dehydrogenase [Actinomycetes bacterium]MCP5031475.1 acyl-CoA dehydrogenase [Actinomycetes bacterium]
MTTDQQLADEIVETVARWVDREVIPNVSEFELADRYPDEMVAQLAAFGLFGATIPAAYGGLGLDVSTYARIIEELSRGWMSLAGVVNSHLIAANLIANYGTEDQRTRWLPQMATAERRGCFSLSEHDSGSDAGALRCKAARDGDEWVINGTKMWVTNGERAGLVALLARAGETDGSDRGITCFLVDKEPGLSSGGITINHNVTKLGYRGLETVEMAYVDHRLPADGVLGGEAGIGQGFHWCLASLELGRVNVAARGVGVARAALDAALDYAGKRETFGKPIGQHQGIQFKLAEMATKVEAARLLTREAALKLDSGERADMAAGMAKLFASETAAEVALDAMRIHGGNGFTTEYPVERYYRDAPLMIIGEGTSEIQKMVIGRALMRGDRP